MRRKSSVSALALFEVIQDLSYAAVTNQRVDFEHPSNEIRPPSSERSLADGAESGLIVRNRVAVISKWMDETAASRGVGIVTIVKKDRDFYQFTKTLETYRGSLDEEVTIILTSDSEFLDFLKRSGR